MPPPPQPSRHRCDRDSDRAIEQALLERIRAGDHDAWGELLTREQDRLYSMCLRMVGDRDKASDLTQEAMVRIIQGLDSYDGRSRLSTWMYRVTMNVALSSLRSEKLRSHASLDAMRGGGEGGRSGTRISSSFEQTREPGAEQAVQEEQRRTTLAEALGRVSPDQRAILILRDARGLEYEQIAAVLEIAIGTVKSRLFRARAALREAIEQETPATIESRTDTMKRTRNQTNDPTIR